MDYGLKTLMMLLLLSILLALAHPHGQEKLVQRVDKGVQIAMVTIVA